MHARDRRAEIAQRLGGPERARGGDRLVVLALDRLHAVQEQATARLAERDRAERGELIGHGLVDARSDQPSSRCGRASPAPPTGAS